eukprot:tig00020934_g16107.t1
MAQQTLLQKVVDAGADVEKLQKLFDSLDKNEQLLLAGGSALLPLIIILIFVFVVFRPTKKGSRVLILGAVNAGKTVLFHQLRDGKRVETHTSMKENEGTFRPHADVDPTAERSPMKPLHIVDFPGHARVRYQLAEQLAAARAVVFVVDSEKIIEEIRSVAEYMYDLMTDKSLRSTKRFPMLVACNKHDSVSAHSIDTVRSKLEREIEQLRRTRMAAPVDSESQRTHLPLGKADEPFEFAKAPFAVQFAPCSASTGKVDTVVAFLRSLSK